MPASIKDCIEHKLWKEKFRQIVNRLQTRETHTDVTHAIDHESGEEIYSRYDRLIEVACAIQYTAMLT